MHGIVRAAYREQVATRIVFFVAGLGTAAWAPLVPYAKARVALDDASLGLVLLCFGMGSIVTMPLTGVLAGRFGCRVVILASGIGVCATLPLLAIAATVPHLAVALFLFGAAVGTVDVAMNIQAVMVEKASGRAMMSGFHGLFSVGGFAGAGGASAVLWLGLSPPETASCVVAVLAILLAMSAGGLLTYGNDGGGKAPLFVLPRGPVILIGLLCCMVFLAEGAMLDWSALFLTTLRGFAHSHGGIGYAVFAICMTLGRLTGDRIVRALGSVRVLLFGGAGAGAGFLVTVLVPSAAASLIGFGLIGLGASNIVPVLFSTVGRQTIMPQNLAVAAITTLGYAGILAGPALIGFIANATSLDVAFAVLACMMLAVGASARVAKR